MKTWLNQASGFSELVVIASSFEKSERATAQDEIAKGLPDETIDIGGPLSCFSPKGIPAGSAIAKGLPVGTISNGAADSRSITSAISSLSLIIGDEVSAQGRFRGRSLKGAPKS